MLTTSFNNNNTITKNNGGWKINFEYGSADGHCKFGLKWSDLTISITAPNKVIEENEIDQKTASFTYHTKDNSEMDQLLVYKTGPIFVNYNNTRTSIDKIDINKINDSEIESFENVSFSLWTARNGNNIINTWDTLFIFQDINGDGVNEIPRSGVVRLSINGYTVSITNLSS